MRLTQAEHGVCRARVAHVGQGLERVGRDPVVVEEARVLTTERPVGQTAQRVEVDMRAIDARLLPEQRSPRFVVLEAVHRARDGREVHRLREDEHLIEAPRIARQRRERPRHVARSLGGRRDANGRRHGGLHAVHDELLIVIIDNRVAPTVVKRANGV